MTEETLRARIERVLFAPIEASGLAFFRIAFGLLMVVSTLRFQAFGWVHDLLVTPHVMFKYPGFAWVRPLPAGAMSALHVALTVLAFFVAIGFCYRASIVAFLLGFTYAQLLDVTNYLNHYYLVVLLGVLMVFMPLGRAWSVDAWLFPKKRVTHFPAWTSYLLRFQVAVVYFYAGLAKLTADWLLHAQPLRIWLAARTSTPIIGPLLDRPWVAYAFSWTGFLFDLTIAFWLMWRKSRPWAYAVVVVFHVMTSILFPIGMFPAIMAVAALVFFDHSWPRRALRRAVPSEVVAPRRSRVFRVGVAVAAAYVVLQVTMPLRHRLYGGNVLWHEQGMRFAWKVMVREKNGSVTYVVEQRGTGRVWYVNPRRYLDDRQLRDFATQPDLILQLGHRIASEYRARGLDVAVRVEALVSLNGRPPCLLVDPSVDLTTVEDSVLPARWILPEPTVDPPHLGPV